jgi:hypothetical protein
MAFPMDLRGLKAQGVDLLFLPDDIHVGTRAIADADAAARYLVRRALRPPNGHHTKPFGTAPISRP